MDICEFIKKGLVVDLSYVLYNSVINSELRDTEQLREYNKSFKEFLD